MSSQAIKDMLQLLQDMQATASRNMAQLKAKTSALDAALECEEGSEAIEKARLEVLASFEAAIDNKIKNHASMKALTKRMA